MHFSVVGRLLFEQQCRQHLLQIHGRQTFEFAGIDGWVFVVELDEIRGQLGVLAENVRK